MASLEYSRLYDYPQAAKALGVSLEWVQRWVGAAIREGLISNKGAKEDPILVTGAALKQVAMKRWQQLETELQWRAFERVRARERGLPMDEGADDEM